MRIALFTPFSPDIGGGAIQLKSVLPHLGEFDLNWYYLASAKAGSYPGIWLGPQLIGGRLASDLARATQLLVLGKSLRLQEVVASMDADLYWIVAMNEGVLVALALTKLGKAVHLTVHDDPVSVFRRSSRYRVLSPLMSRWFSRLLQSVKSVDVISSGMRDLYHEKFGIEAAVVYRYVESLPRLRNRIIAGDVLRVGHIGIVYHAREFRGFVEALQMHGRKLGVSIKLRKRGRSREFERVQLDYPDMVEDLGNIPESSAIEQLSKCHFLYSMYPCGRRFEVFRKTSQPMKLSTYVQAQRPIFAHAPEDSTLASVVRRYRIGFVCPSVERQDIEVALMALHELGDVPVERFEKARAELLGVAQVRELGRILESSGMRG